MRLPAAPQKPGGSSLHTSTAACGTHLLCPRRPYRRLDISRQRSRRLPPTRAPCAAPTPMFSACLAPAHRMNVGGENWNWKGGRGAGRAFPVDCVAHGPRRASVPSPTSSRHTRPHPRLTHCVPAPGLCGFAQARPAALSPEGGSPSTLQLRTLTMVKLLLLLIALCAVAHGRTMLEQGERARVSWYGRMPGVGSRFALQAAPPAL